MSFDREQIEARLALDLIASADMPQIAQDALEAGFDGPATVRLAILEHPTYFEVAEVFPRVVKELGLAQVTTGEAALRLAKEIAREILRKGDDPLQHVRAFESLWIRSKYAKEIRTLGTLYDDVWIAQSMGRSDQEIRDSVTSALRTFAK
ncbi:MAG TPA: hypothetical protein VF753_08330 [Terriglobales bacterium]